VRRERRERQRRRGRQGGRDLEEELPSREMMTKMARKEFGMLSKLMYSL
jgi:hypothetical protein